MQCGEYHLDYYWSSFLRLGTAIAAIGDALETAIVAIGDALQTSIAVIEVAIDAIGAATAATEIEIDLGIEACPFYSRCCCCCCPSVSHHHY